MECRMKYESNILARIISPKHPATQTQKDAVLTNSYPRIECQEWDIYTLGHFVNDFCKG